MQILLASRATSKCNYTKWWQLVLELLQFITYFIHLEELKEMQAFLLILPVLVTKELMQTEEIEVAYLHQSLASNGRRRRRCIVLFRMLCKTQVAIIRSSKVHKHLRRANKLKGQEVQLHKQVIMPASQALTIRVIWYSRIILLILLTRVQTWAWEVSNILPAQLVWVDKVPTEAMEEGDCCKIQAPVRPVNRDWTLLVVYKAWR